MSTTTNRRKTVWIDETIEVNAPIADVVALIKDIRGWADWVDGVKKIISPSQTIRQGSLFMFVLKMEKTPLLALPNKVYEWSDTRLEWGGGVSGVGANIRHRMEFTAVDDNTTLLRHYEYATGIAAVLTMPFARAAYKHDHQWSASIKAHFKNKKA